MNKVINILLTTLISALLCFCWTRYFVKNNTVSLLASIVFASATAYVCAVGYSKSNKKVAKKSANKKQSAALSDKLRFNADNADLFAPLLRYFGYNVASQTEDYLTCEKDGKTYLVEIDFAADKLTAENLAPRIVHAKRTKADTLFVFCRKIHPSVADAEGQFDFRAIDANETYRLFVEANKLPDLPMPHKQRGIIASYALCRARFGWYLFGAFWTAATSLFSYFKIYSLLWATILFALALYSLLNRRYNPTSKSAFAKL